MPLIAHRLRRRNLRIDRSCSAALEQLRDPKIDRLVCFLRVPLASEDVMAEKQNPR